jgi:hypothetical protein
MQQKVEIKIRHGLATGALPVIERNSGSGHHSRPEAEKANGADIYPSK